MCNNLDVEAIFYLNDGNIIKTEGFNYEKAWYYFYFYNHYNINN